MYIIVHVFVSCMLYMPLTQTMGTTVHFNKFYSILFYSILHVWSYDFYDMTLSTGKQRRHMINIDYGYTLEPPRRGGSYEYEQFMIWSTNEKNRYTPAYPSFAI